MHLSVVVNCLISNLPFKYFVLPRAYRPKTKSFSYQEKEQLATYPKHSSTMPSTPEPGQEEELEQEQSESPEIIAQPVVNCSPSLIASLEEALLTLVSTSRVV